MDSTRIDAIYTEIFALSLELSPDPTTGGPKYLQEAISKCRNYLNRTTMVLLELSQHKRRVKNLLSAAEVTYEIRENEMLATDERVRRQPALSDRKAMAATLLQDEAREVRSLRDKLRNLEDVEKAVRLRHDELVRTDGAIRTQRNLIRDELETGSFYGDEGSSPGPSRGRRKPSASDINGEDFDVEALFGKASAEMSPPVPEPVREPIPEAPTEPTPKPVAEAPPPAEESKADKERPPQAASTDEEDLASFLSAGPVDDVSKPEKAKTKPAPTPAPAPQDADFDFQSILQNL